MTSVFVETGSSLCATASLSIVSEAASSRTVPSTSDAARRRGESKPAAEGDADRSRLAILWYRFAQGVLGTLFGALGGWRATGRQNIPPQGAGLLVANHASYLDVLLMGISVHRPLNYVARSSLFVPPLSWLMRSVGGFPIQREGMGASGMKETLRRLRSGGIVVLFPEGTRTADGEMGPLKPGIAVLVARAGVPVFPAGIAGTFDAWPRSRPFPLPRPLRIHFGPPITPEQIAGMDSEAVTALIAQKMGECVSVARDGLRRDRGG
jgi:1-acyl-sn-glycerol-3-phosphate acyltransferase